MNSRRALILFSLGALCACSSGPEQTTPETGNTDPTMTMAMNTEYQGPPIRAELEAMESQPPQYAVEVGAQVPTAGWALSLDEVVLEDGATVVRMKLTEPAADALVAQVMQDLRTRVPLREEPAVVHVSVSRWQRGVRYLVAPEAKLAVVVER